MKRSFLLVVVLGLAVAGLATFASTRGGGDRTYITAAVERGNIVTVVTASGRVNAVVTVQVGSQLSGQIAKLFVDFNHEVQAAQPIAELDPQAFEARVQESKAALEVAEANLSAKQAALKRAEASLANARASLGVVQARTASTRAIYDEANRDLQRKQALSERGTVSASALGRARAERDAAAAELRAAGAQEKVHATTILMAESELRMAEAEVQKARATITEKEAALSHAEVELKRTVIRAPIDGVVIGRNIDEGQTVAASLEAPILFTIAKDLRDMNVETSVDEADIGRVRVGQRAIFTVDSYPARNFTGTVKQIRKAPILSQNVVTYTVIVSAENPDLALLPGMTANVRIVVDEATNVLKVPNATLRFTPPGVSRVRAEISSGAETADGEPDLAWILDADGHPISVPIRIGISDGIVTEVVSGPLKEGQEVITIAVPQADERSALPWPWKS